MSTRTPYTPAQVRQFIAQARGGRETNRERLEAMRHHPAGSALETGTRVLSGHRPIPRDLPPLLDADGCYSEPLPTTEPLDQ